VGDIKAHSFFLAFRPPLKIAFWSDVGVMLKF